MSNEKPAFANRRNLAAICALLCLAGCAQNNIPGSDLFGEVPAVTTARVFVDANGQFYPSNWRKSYGGEALRKRHTLEAIAGQDDARRADLSADTARQLREIGDQMRGKRRIFILVHGYNNTEWEAGFPYDAITAALQPTADDMVLRFHWDGMVQTTPGGQLGSWFKAVGFSQMAGMRGLRAILNQAHNADIFVISHSRGASVTLSALANPSFIPEFQQPTEAVTGPFAAFPALAPNGNRIRAIMLGPAIGLPDFWAESCHGAKNCPTLRDFGPQLVSIRYTINGGDTVLKKVISALATRYNATDFGYRDRIGATLSGTYDCLHPEKIEPGHGHAFNLYVQDTAFLKMVTAAQSDTGSCRKTTSQARR